MKPAHRYSRRPIALLHLFLFLVLQGFGQGSGVLGFEFLTVDEGLSHNTVYAILQDKNGLIWLGTRYGLNRYDAYKCDVYLPDADDKNAIKGYTTLCLAEDRQGKLWIGHRGAGISIYDQNTGIFERFPGYPDTTMNWNTVTIRSIFEDSRGWIWVGTAGNGALVFDKERKKIRHFSTSLNATLPNDFIFDFVEDQQGDVWIATDGKGINVYHSREDRIEHKDAGDANDMSSFEKSLCRDAAGNIWIGTAGNGLYQYLPGKNRFVHFTHEPGKVNSLSHNIITDITADKNGRLWITTDGGGLNTLDTRTGQFTRYIHRPDFPGSLNTNALYQVMIDQNGNLWVTSFNGGVNIHKAFNPPFEILENKLDYEQKGLRSVLALYEAEDGRVWLGTDGNGLFYVEEKNQKLELHTTGCPHPVITCIQPAGKDRLWLGTFAEGLSLYDTRTGLVRNFSHLPTDPNSIAHNNVWDLEPDGNGGLWIATLGGGLDYLPPGEQIFRHFRRETGNPNSLSSVQIVDVLLDRNGRYLWAASEDNGLDRLETATGQIAHFGADLSDKKRQLCSNNIQCLYQDKPGAIWVGTEFGGLDRIRPDSSVRHFNTGDGLPSNRINSIQEDENGRLWISTQKGIVCWDPGAQTFVDYGQDPNLKNNQYNPRASLKTGKGRLLFGGATGFTVLAPEKIVRNPYPPKVVLTDIRILGQSVLSGGWNGRKVLETGLDAPEVRVHLSYADRGIVFEFTATDYTNPAKNRYAYQLEGFDEHWNYVDADQRRAIFSSLKGGKYTLKIRASNNDQVWGAIRTVQVIVDPPFWETWWFIGLCILGALVIAFFLFRFFLNKQKRQFEKEAMKAEQEILRLTNENLERELESRQSRLSASLLQTAHKNKFLNDLKDNILKLDEKDARGLRRIIRAIDTELTDEDYWEQFQLTFNQMHQHFIHELRLRHPGISSNDQRLCCFVRMEMTNLEIATVLHVTVNAVEQTKYRLKKKIGLDKNASLTEYIRQL